MSDASEWPEPPARVYPHRYNYCIGCDRVVRDFQGDAVWRDREGGTLCMSKGMTFHRVAPPEPSPEHVQELLEAPRPAPFVMNEDIEPIW